MDDGYWEEQVHIDDEPEIKALTGSEGEPIGVAVKNFATIVDLTIWLGSI